MLSILWPLLKDLGKLWAAFFRESDDNMGPPLSLRAEGLGYLHSVIPIAAPCPQDNSAGMGIACLSRVGRGERAWNLTSKISGRKAAGAANLLRVAGEHRSQPHKLCIKRGVTPRLRNQSPKQSRGVAATAKARRERDRVKPGRSYQGIDCRSGRLPGVARMHLGHDVREPTQGWIRRGGLKTASNSGLLPMRGLSPKTGYEPAEVVAAECHAPPNNPRACQSTTECLLPRQLAVMAGMPVNLL